MAFRWIPRRVAMVVRGGGRGVVPALLLRVALVALVAVSHCAKQSGENPILQTDDLISDSQSFDKGSIVSVPALTDWQSIATAQVQQFLERTPYDRRSFLSTYQSNGVRAADAIVRSAGHYQINPIAFLARAEMEGGLIGEEFYPTPSARVEYVFGCGCVGGSTNITSGCDPAMAGFDVQVDCLGHALRERLDAVTTSGATFGQWAAGQPKLTLDNVTVVPADAATAALYDYTPVVAFQKAGGNWLFWNLWNKYALALGYFGNGPAALTVQATDPSRSP